MCVGPIFTYHKIFFWKKDAVKKQIDLMDQIPYLVKNLLSTSEE